MKGNDYSRFYNQPHTDAPAAYAKMVIAFAAVIGCAIIGLGIAVVRYFAH